MGKPRLRLQGQIVACASGRGIHRGDCERSMTCHPTTGDLLFRSRDRVLPGLCVWSRMRAGRDVFDLHGRLQGCRPGRRVAESAGASAQRAGKVSEILQTVRNRGFVAQGQHSGATRVKAGRLACDPSPVTDRLPESTMTEGTDFPVRRHALLQRAGATDDVCLSLACSLPPEVRRFTAPMISVFRDAGPLPCSHGPMLFPSFRRAPRKIAGGEQISTGVTRTSASKNVAQTSVIVLVTSEGTVRLAPTDTPRG